MQFIKKDEMEATLTPKEQLLIKELQPGSVIDIRTIEDLSKRKGLADRQGAIRIVRSLAMKNVLYRIKRGIFYLPSNGTFDPYIIAPYLFNGYISFESALFLYGYAQTHSEKIFTAIEGNRSKEKSIYGYTFSGIPMGGFAFGFTFWKGYRIASKAKALFDCAYKIWLISDISTLLRLIASFEPSDYNELLKYLAITKNTLLKERVGLLLEKARADESVLEKVESMLGKRIVGRLLPNREVKGILSKRWGIYDNSNR
ncbi:MAG: type IV toxin-antitoxin system AbiEi family antitoxin domain-containing protein [Candidatus Micrarchaeia archaeon]